MFFEGLGALLKITCRGGQLFEVDGQHLSMFDTLACEKRVSVNIDDARKFFFQGNSCSHPGKLKSIGFNIAGNTHLTYILSCINMENLNVMWTEHTIDGGALEGMHDLLYETFL
jgi:hypothetical protein